jgi:hypothetical protein
VILLPNGDMLRCESCGQPIADAADGVKLCDGKIVHSICGTRTH